MLAASNAAEAEREVDQRVTIPSARLQQQHVMRRVLRQPCRQHATGRAGADDHTVESLHVSA